MAETPISFKDEEIVRLYKSGHSGPILAKIFGVTKWVIYRKLRKVGMVITGEDKKRIRDRVIFLREAARALKRQRKRENRKDK